MPLSDLQQRVAEIVFALDESEGFALAGGGALIAHDVVDRTTRDLDCFGPSRDAVDRYWPAIVGALQEAGFAVEVRVANHGFAKMIVSDPVTGDVTQVDVGFDPAGKAAVAMLFGRVRAIDDLAADKLLALFGRAAPRDFVDVQAPPVHASRARGIRHCEGSRLQLHRATRRVRCARLAAALTVRGW